MLSWCKKGNWGKNDIDNNFKGFVNSRFAIDGPGLTWGVVPDAFAALPETSHCGP